VNFVLLTYDSCRYDVMVAARTPVLDSYAAIVRAEAPATFTYASHQAFFVGMLPNAIDDTPYYNRFRRQLIGLRGVGEGQVVKDALQLVQSDWSVVRGLRDEGYQTVGAGAVNWFRQASLTGAFERFRFTGTDADRQIDFLVSEIDPRRPYFGFINFGETHAPYEFRGNPRPCSVDVRARRMTWPPAADADRAPSAEAFRAQVAAAEFLDRRLPRLFDALSPDTVVIVTADHGECFGEDGYWGHGVNHPKVFEVPLSIFRLDRQPLPG
jgi:hypothetical protein